MRKHRCGFFTKLFVYSKYLLYFCSEIRVTNISTRVFRYSKNIVCMTAFLAYGYNDNTNYYEDFRNE